MKACFAAFLILILNSAAGWSQTAEELIQKGETFDQKMEATEALKYYLPAEKLDPKNGRLMAQIARQYRHLMTDASNREEKIRLGRTAIQYSQRAAALAPKDAEAQLSPAISYGKITPFLTSKEQVENSPKIKASVDRALALDPRNDTALHILGRWHRVLAEITGVKRALAGAIYGKLPPGSLPDAERNLTKAVSVNPNRLMHQIELGRIYAQMGRKDEARKYITKGLAMANREKDDPEIKNLGRQALEKL